MTGPSMGNNPYNCMEYCIVSVATEKSQNGIRIYGTERLYPASFSKKKTASINKNQKVVCGNLPKAE